MRKIDIGIIIVLVAAVVFSGIGVATYEGGPQGVDYDVTWGTDNNQLASKAGTRTGNGDVSIDYPIDLDNITEVTITVTVAGPGPRAQAVTASVDLTPINATKPAGKSVTLAPGQAASQQTSFTVKIQDLPTVTTASGADENATRGELNSTHRTETGSGTWKVVVTISGSGLGPLGAAGEAFTVTVSGQATTYRPTLELSTPDINR